MDKHNQGVKYENEEDRRKGYLVAQKRHAYKPWVCNSCNVEILKGNKTNHLKSKRHLNNLAENIK
jgi:ribosomal protein L37AE/L43A